ncbi:MAG: hypothetical protein C0424_01840 [Sphingobacteriaceae bacterium]|nr:hypothetical protein [Sphingobacteriaceae bacterium]
MLNTHKSGQNNKIRPTKGEAFAGEKKNETNEAFSKWKVEHYVLRTILCLVDAPLFDVNNMPKLRPKAQTL